MYFYHRIGPDKNPGFCAKRAIMSKKELLDQLNKMMPQTLMETLEMRYVDLDLEKGELVMTMPVNHRVHQPMGFLHGGASAALAESVGSASSVLYIDREKFSVMGIELSCNHLRAKKDGQVWAKAKILHRGRRTHLWEIRITDEQDRLISHCKLTNMIVPLESEKK